jgi:FKBP-type peptidyl-prolyl cis-trans isomerase FkpA
MKNLSILFLLVLLILSGFSSCNSSSKQKTLNGFDMVFLDDQKGDLAKEDDYVYFRYHVMANDSLVFSSTMQTPLVKFKLPKLEKVTDLKNAQPVTEALHLMSKGDSVIVYQKIDEDFKKAINLPNQDILDFHVVLVDIKNESEFKLDQEADLRQTEENNKVFQEQADAVGLKAKSILEEYQSKKLDKTIMKTASGLKYIIHEEGTGNQAESGKPVSVNYYGLLMDGNRFDDSWSRGQDFTFQLGQGQVIKGWDEGVLLLKEGSKASLFIHSDLAYGAQGSPPVIPANAELMFYIEVKKVH